MNKERKPRYSDILSDDEIIELYWKRSELAISETDKKYQKYLHTVAYNILHDNMDCEECLNDTYLGAWNAIPPERPSIFQAFLTKIMRNTAVVRYKKNTAKKRLSSQLSISIDEISDSIPYPSSVEEEYLLSELGSIINKFIKDLPERQAFIFICRYYCSDSIINIASMLHVSERTIFNELKDIRYALKKILTKEGYFNE